LSCFQVSVAFVTRDLADDGDGDGLIQPGVLGAHPIRPASPRAADRVTMIGIPARIASSARRLTLHLPKDWPWETAWTVLFDRACGPPATAIT